MAATFFCSAAASFATVAASVSGHGDTNPGVPASTFPQHVCSSFDFVLRNVVVSLTIETWQAFKAEPVANGGSSSS